MILLTKIEMKSDLEKTKNNLRDEMILIGTKERLSSKRTIKLSNKLDYYIIWLQKFNDN
jgi:hypothetical protein